jgi:hypothetical protein
MSSSTPAAPLGLTSTPCKSPLLSLQQRDLAHAAKGFSPSLARTALGDVTNHGE